MIEKEFHLPACIRRILFPDASLITFTGETRGESIHGWMKRKAGNSHRGPWTRAACRAATGRSCFRRQHGAPGLAPRLGLFLAGSPSENRGKSLQYAQWSEEPR